MKKYKIIYADPPWDYKDKRDKHPRLCGGASAHYVTTPTKDLAQLDVASICDTDCMLFMWVTFPTLPDAISLISSWGFKYKTLGFSWIKLNKKNLKPFFGIGYYTKSNCECCLIGVKGKPIKISDSVSSVIIEPRMEHSKKPTTARDRIVQLCGDVPRLEMFCRGSAEGWDVFGNEAENSIEIPIKGSANFNINQQTHGGQSVSQPAPNCLTATSPC